MVYFTKILLKIAASIKKAFKLGFIVYPSPNTAFIKMQNFYLH